MKEGYWKKGMSKYCSKTMCTHHNNKQIHAQTRKKVYVIQFLVFVLLLIFSNKALVYCILLWIFTTVHHATLKTHIFDHLIRLLTNFFILFFSKKAIHHSNCLFLSIEGYFENITVWKSKYKWKKRRHFIS